MSDFILYLYFKSVKEEFPNVFLILTILNVLHSQRDDKNVCIINGAHSWVGALNIFLKQQTINSILRKLDVFKNNY